MKKRFTPVLLLLLAALQAAPAFAEEDAEKKLTLLDTVVVTADRSEDTLRETPQNVTVISGADIENSAASSLVDALKREGIQVFWTGTENYGNEKIVMRGGKSSMNGFDLSGDVLLLVDGRRAGTDNFSAIGLDNIERVEIIHGPGAVQYGSSAVGGVINVITKRGHKTPSVRFEAGLGSYDGQNYKAFASGMLGNLDIAAWGNYAKAGDYEDGDGEVHLNSGLNYRAKYGFNAGWNFSGSQRIGISFAGMNGDHMEMGEQGSSTYANQYQDRDYYMADIVYDGTYDAAGLSWLARYYFGKTDSAIYRQSLRPASRGQVAKYSDSTNKMQGGQAQLSWEGLEWLKLTGGVDALYYDMDQDQPFGIHTTAAMANDTESEYLNIGAFLMGKLYLLENRSLVISAGGRYDYFNVEADTVRSRGLSSERHQKSESDIDNFLPSFGIAYSPLDFIKLRANYGHSFRMPTPRELGGLFAMSGSTVFVGNPDLDPETSKTWDVGFDLAWNAFDFSFTYFDTDYKDKITALSAGSVPGRPNDRPYVNLERAYVAGMEISVGYDIGAALSLPFSLAPYASWTHLTRYRDGDDFYLSDTAKDSVAWGISLKSGQTGTDASLDFVYYGSAKSSPNTTTGEQSDYPGGSTVADFTINQRVVKLSNDSEVKVKIAVKNIFDKYYTTYQEDYMPGRSFYTGFVYTY